MSSKEQYLHQCTLEEKQQLTSGQTNWTFFGVKRLGLPTLTCADGPHGVRAYKREKGNPFHGSHLQPATLFPVAAAMASTFNPSLIERVGETIGTECNLYDVDLLLAPGINLKRSPLGGRNFEYYSEDPYLTAEIASAFVKGVQSTGVGATIKHFALNEQEYQRRWINTIADERTMHELYLRPFHDVIKQANPRSIMTSYNRINGHYAGESQEMMKHILRDKWNYKGFVISDWGGVQHKVKSVVNGMNLEMPGPGEFKQQLRDAVNDGTITEQQLDESLVPLFDFYDEAIKNPNKGNDVDFDQHHNVAQNVAREAIVLLENDGILPLQEHTKLAVVGAFADVPRINGGGSATVRAYHTEQPLEELQKYYQVQYAKGYEEENTSPSLLQEVQQVCETQDVILYFTGTTASLETEGDDRPHMHIPQGHLDVLEVLAQLDKPLIVVLNTGSAINVMPVIKHANALIESWLLGGANAVALIDIIRGVTNPSGRLAETFPTSIKQTPHYGQFPSQEDEVYIHGDIINMGYRYYDTHDYVPRYPFGYGLSYTTFAYKDITLSSNEINEENKIIVNVEIENTGDVDGYEVVQLYIHDATGIHAKPYKQLRGFDKVFIPAGEHKTVSFELDKDDVAFYDVHQHDFVLENGQSIIMVGSNVSDIHLTAEIQVVAKPRTETHLTMDHPLKLFSQLKPAVYKDFEETFGVIPWYNIEEPAGRVINRLGRRHQLSTEEVASWKHRLLTEM